MLCIEFLFNNSLSIIVFKWESIPQIAGSNNLNNEETCYLSFITNIYFK